MKYQNLRIISYNNADLYEKEYKKRFESAATFRTGLNIVPFSTIKGIRISSEKYELFYFSTTENQLLEDKIFRNSNKISRELDKLPPIAQRKMLFSHIINEIQSNNEFEGVRSTRKELAEAAKFKNTSKKLRFKGIVSQYLNIGDSKYEKIKSVEDFRKIYDNLFLDDMDEENLPDGKLFRKSTVYIQDELRNVHQGSSNESSIISDLEVLINFMNSSSYPFLLKAAVTHYYFEYIHPFYDGNGRMGRFILSSYLARKLDKFTGISISNAVGKNKNNYLDSFVEVSNPKNKGELTFFVKMIYELIVEGQESTLEDLTEYSARLKHDTEYIDNLESVTEQEKKVLFIYIQNKIFDEINPLEDEELSKNLDISRYLLNRELNSLKEKGIIKQIQKKPSIHVLTDEFKMQIEGY